MKQAISQEPMSDSSHSCIPEVSESTVTSNRVKSAAMLGIALSVGASGALVPQAEASATISAPAASDTTKAFSSDSKISTNTAAEAGKAVTTSRQTVVAYHTVASGESLWQIAQQHRVGLQDLKIANQLPVEASIRVGQVLRVPATASNISSTGTSETGATLAAEQVVEENAVIASNIEFEIDQSSAKEQSEEVEENAAVASARAEDNEATPTALSQVNPSVEIEIADASEAIEQPSVVTALAAPQPLSSYRIQAGDTLASIASALGTTPQEIISINDLTNPDIIIAGSTLRVPAANGERALAQGGQSPSARRVAVSQFPSSSERLAYLQSTAVRPDAARILDDLRAASPTEPVSVGGEEVTEQDIIGSERSSESVDPYVANLLEEVQEIREQSVQVSEEEN